MLKICCVTIIKRYILLYIFFFKYKCVIYNKFIQYYIFFIMLLI